MYALRNKVEDGEDFNIRSNYKLKLEKTKDYVLMVNSNTPTLGAKSLKFY